MAQVPTYNDIRVKNQADAQAANAAQAQQATGQQVQNDVQVNRNAVLDRAMNEYAGRGLGNPNQAAQVVNPQEQYEVEAVDAVMKGKLDPAVFMQDPNIREESKSMILGLMQGGPQDNAPAGLGQVR